jgi:hypothetical protein
MRNMAMVTRSWRHSAKWRGCLGLEAPTVGFVGLLGAQRPPTCGRLKQPLMRMRKYDRRVPVVRVTIPDALSPTPLGSIVHYVSIRVHCPKTGDLLLDPRSAYDDESLSN